MAEQATEVTEVVETSTTDTVKPDQTAEVEKWKALARKHEVDAKAGKAAAARLAEIEESTKSETEKLLAAARKEASDEATRAVTETSNRRILTAEVKAAAGTKLADPADAVRLLDLSDFEVDADGNVDQKKITAAIDGLLQQKPYLAAAGDGRPRGNADQGARESAGTDNTPRGLISAGLAKTTPQ